MKPETKPGNETLPGLIEAPPAILDDQAAIELWRWTPLAGAQAPAAARRPCRRRRAFSLAKGVTTGYAEAVDDRRTPDGKPASDRQPPGR
jgi:hypothetical protein